MEMPVICPICGRQTYWAEAPSYGCCKRCLGVKQASDQDRIWPRGVVIAIEQLNASALKTAGFRYIEYPANKQTSDRIKFVRSQLEQILLELADWAIQVSWREWPTGFFLEVWTTEALPLIKAALEAKGFQVVPEQVD